MTELDRSRHLHPLSILFEIAKTIRSNLIPTVAALLSTRSGSIIGYYIGFGILSVGLIIAIIRYFTFRYRIADGQLVVNQGLFGRLNRTVPLDRIQNIDLSQNLFHRLLRVGEVRIETASGNEPEAVMRVLSIAEYSNLKIELAGNGLADSSRNLGSPLNHPGEMPNAGLPTGDQAPTVAPVLGMATATRPAAATRLVLALPARSLAIAGLISNRGEVIAGVLFGLFWQMKIGDSYFSWERSIPFVSKSKRKSEMAEAIQNESAAVQGYLQSISDNYGVIASGLALLGCLALLFAVLRLFSAMWFLMKFYGYRLEVHGDSLHLNCGLFTKVSATIPVGRVQLISIHRSWLMRALGLASIRIETAGGSEESENTASTVGRRWFVPIAQYNQVPGILNAIDPRIQFDESKLTWQPLSPKAASRMFRPIVLTAVINSIVFAYFWPTWGWSVGIVVAVFGYVWTRKKSKSKRYARTEWGILFRSGVILQKCSMTFFEKIQSVQLNESPFDRRWGMSSISFDTASSGPADHKIDVSLLEKDFASNELEAIHLKLQAV